MTFVRVWFHFEIIFFFVWLCSIILYLQLTFWSKAQPIYKNEENLLADDNVWNDKNTEDYLRWHKYESFKICFQVTFIATDIIISGVIWNHKIYRYGPIEFSKIGLLFIVMISHRVCILLIDLFVMKFKMSNAIYAGTTVFKIIIFVVIIVFL